MATEQDVQVVRDRLEAKRSTLADANVAEAAALRAQDEELQLAALEAEERRLDLLLASTNVVAPVYTPPTQTVVADAAVVSQD